MREPAQICMLPNGRLHLHDGPIDLIIHADGTPTAVEQAYRAAATRFVTVLDELCAELPLLRAQALPNSPRPRGPIAQRMFDAVLRSAGFQQASPGRALEPCLSPPLFITPMAAVAGAVAEAILTEMTNAAKFDRAYVNNGGDIALHVTPGHSYSIGMVERPETPTLFGSAEISAESNIRGIATSGWRGRSFSLGIADAVTVLASTAPAADAAATIIANAVNLPNHPAMTRVPANQIAPDSDLREIPITRNVGPLSIREIHQALNNGVRAAKTLQSQELIRSAALCLQGQVRVTCRDALPRPSADATQPRLVPRRSLQHA